MANPEKNGGMSQPDSACGSSCGVQKDGTQNKTYFPASTTAKTHADFRTSAWAREAGSYTLAGVLEYA